MNGTWVGPWEGPTQWVLIKGLLCAGKFAESILLCGFVNNICNKTTGQYHYDLHFIGALTEL